MSLTQKLGKLAVFVRALVKGVGEYQVRVIRDDAGKVKGVQRTIGFRGLTLDRIE